MAAFKTLNSLALVYINLKEYNAATFVRGLGFERNVFSYFGITMKSTRYRLDRLLRQHTRKSPRAIRLLLVSKRIVINNQIATDMNQLVTQFCKVSVDGLIIQNDSPVYIVFNKPKGVVCATKDQHHTTVIDLLDEPGKSELHIAGRLDYNTSGLVLLTNNGNWSRRLSSPEHGVTKRYLVTVEQPLTPEYTAAFARGIYFAYENITTLPSVLHITGDFTAELTLTEGRYHQIKRMFGAFQNKVLALHRYAVGNLVMEGSLPPGTGRALSDLELIRIFDNALPGTEAQLQEWVPPLTLALAT